MYNLELFFDAALEEKARISATQNLEDEKLAKRIGCNVVRVRQMRASLRPIDFDKVALLLKARRFNNEYKSSCASQVRIWLLDPNTRFSKPLTDRQLSWL